MKIIISFFLLSIIASCSYFKINSSKVKVQENFFVEGSRDIPLVVGMNKINEDNIGFDSSVGSISLVIYSFKNNPQDLLEFYVATFNQLGWKFIDKTSDKIYPQKYNFKRDKENLSLEINSANPNFTDKKIDKVTKINTIKFFFSSSL